MLLAEIAAESGRATIAHDAAVPNASLLAAAAGTGVGAKIVTGPHAAAAAASLTGMPPRRLLTLAAAGIALLAIVDAFNPRLGGGYVLLSMLTSCVWAFIIARAMFRRRR